MIKQADNATGILSKEDEQLLERKGWVIRNAKAKTPATSEEDEGESEEAKPKPADDKEEADPKGTPSSIAGAGPVETALIQAIQKFYEHRISGNTKANKLEKNIKDAIDLARRLEL